MHFVKALTKKPCYLALKNGTQLKKTTTPTIKKSQSAKAHKSTDLMQDAELAAQVLRHFRSVFNAIKTHFQQVEKQAGIGGAQVWALSTILARPGIGMNDLALAMDIHQTTASNLVKNLFKLGLVKVEKNGPDKRAVQLYILTTAQSLLEKVPGPFSGVLPKALSELNPKTLRRLEQDLGQLLQLLKTDSKAAKTPLANM